MKCMWIRDAQTVRPIVVEPYGHPANRVWRDVKTDRRYDEGAGIYASEIPALEAERASLRAIIDDLERSDGEIAQRLDSLRREASWPDLSPNVSDAVVTAQRYAMTDGAHHKQWVIDQMLRALLGDAGYKDWRTAYGYDDWDEGIAP